MQKSLKIKFGISLTERNFTRNNFRIKMCDSLNTNTKQTHFKQTVA